MHSHKIPAQIIFPRQLIHPRTVIYPLIGLQFGKLLGCHTRSVVPVEVPVRTKLIVGQLETQLAAGFTNYHITAFCCAEVKILLLFLFVPTCVEFLFTVCQGADNCGTRSGLICARLS